MAPTSEDPRSEKPSGLPHRKPFEGRAQPESFFRAPEFQRFVWLAGVLLVVGIMGYSALSGSAGRVTPSGPGSASTTGTSGTTSTTSATAAVPALTAEERAAREQLLKSRFEGTLADTRNGQAFAETQGYEHLLQLLASYPAEEVERLATRKLDWAAARADPDAWRGQFVWTRGVIAHRWAERLKNPVSDITDVYRVILTDGDGSDGLVVDMLEEPPHVARQSDPVDVQGIFYRTVKYPNAAKKTEEVEVPYLLVKTMRPVVKPDRDAAGIFHDHGAAALMAIAIVIGGARLLIYVFQRRSRRPGRISQAGPQPGTVGFRKLFEQRTREKNRTAGPRSES
jgi:hypothetical protein